VRNRAIRGRTLNPGEKSEAKVALDGAGHVCLGLSVGGAWRWGNGLVKAWGGHRFGNDLICGASWSLAALAEATGAPSASPLLTWRKSAAQPFSKNSTGKPRPVTSLLRALLQTPTKVPEPERARPCSRKLRNSGDPISRALATKAAGDCRSPLGGKRSRADQLPADPLLQRLSCQALGGNPVQRA